MGIGTVNPSTKLHIIGNENSITRTLGQISSGGKVGESLVSFLADSKKGLQIGMGDKNTTDSGNIAHWVTFNPERETGGLNSKGRTTRPPFIGLAHELAHVQDSWNGTQDNTFWFSSKDEKGKTRITTFKEVYASFVENQIRGENGLSLRAYYSPTASSNTKISTEVVNRMLKNLAVKLVKVQPQKKQIQQISLSTFKSKN